ncbi:MAG: outer membrane protein assembly factor BamA [Bacteroidales bacterium]|nr:outer membrane protein assembly factor BamA [Bacteroidales bacterium]
MKKICLLIAWITTTTLTWAQSADSTAVVDSVKVPAAPVVNDTIFNPSVNHTSNVARKYTIQGIEVTGADNYEDYVLIGFSGLSVGQKVSVPGDEISNAIKRFWKQGLFSDVRITLEKVRGDDCWIKIALTQRPRIANIEYDGVKKSEREDLDVQMGVAKGSQVTPNIIDRAKKVIKRYYDEKGYKNAEVEIFQSDSKVGENMVDLTVFVDKHEKVKVHALRIDGLAHWDSVGIRFWPVFKKDYMTYRGANRALKKTNARHKWYNIFRAKKFTDDLYKEDKKALIDKFHELGYRDARIVSDTVSKYDEKHVDITLHLEEGQRYYIRHIDVVGNSVHSADDIKRYLMMKRGDIYNQVKLRKRINEDEDGVSSLYMDNGYLFFQLDPIEVNIEGDSIDLELRVSEGPQAHVNQVVINGNDRLYEHVVRRELRVRPGELFSKSDLIRSARELAQTGHFDPEKMNPRPVPNVEDGTVDIIFDLESKANDQIEFSLGWGSTGLIGRISLKLTNISMKDIFHPERYHGIYPQGDGETFTISAQTNAKYYQSYSMQYINPWVGGKRPNSLSVSLYYSRQSDINSNYYNSRYYNNYNNYYNGYNGYGYGYGGYGYNSGYGSSSYEYAIDPDKSIQMLGASLGFGKRLNWPDDYFTLQTSLNYNVYILKDWQYFPVTNGTSNSLSIEGVLSRNSIDNPYFTRSGSSFSVDVELAPPYSLFEGKNKYADDDDKYSKAKMKWLEFYKVKFSTKTFTPLTSGTRTLVFHTRSDMGFLGHYNKYKKSPFDSYYMGGDGNSYYSSSYITEYIPLRGYENGAITGGYPTSEVATCYTRFVAELRYPFMLESSSTIYGLAFAEAGNAWTSFKYFNPFALKRSLGAGVRIFLPMIGMLGIDWGYGFDPCFGSKTNSGSNFHFVIGQEF